jgi:hypothetical protein
VFNTDCKINMFPLQAMSILNGLIKASFDQVIVCSHLELLACALKGAGGCFESCPSGFSSFLLWHGPFFLFPLTHRTSSTGF